MTSGYNSGQHAYFSRLRWTENSDRSHSPFFRNFVVSPIPFSWSWCRSSCSPLYVHEPNFILHSCSCYRNELFDDHQKTYIEHARNFHIATELLKQQTCSSKGKYRTFSLHDVFTTPGASHEHVPSLLMVTGVFHWSRALFDPPSALKGDHTNCIEN